MSEKTVVYGVFFERKLVFREDMSYAIYEREDFARSEAKEFTDYFDCKYEVRAVELDCSILSGMPGKEENDK